MLQQNSSVLKTPAEWSLIAILCAYKGRGQSSLSVSFLPKSCALVGETGKGGKVKWKGGRRKINGERENMVRREVPCTTFRLVAAKSHFLQLHASMSCWAVQKKLPQEREFNF